jgi:hypothetical protein
MDDVITALREAADTDISVPCDAILVRARRLRRRRYTAIGACATLVSVLAFAGLQSLRPTTVVVSGRVRLAVPAIGQTDAEFLDDGSPVFVVHHRDGTISVVSALSTHRPWGVGAVIGWCARARDFEDWSHGSVWDETGAKVAGPAPGGLETYPILKVDGDSVEVDDVVNAGLPPGSPPGRSRSGPQCYNEGGQGTNVVPDFASRPTYEFGDALRTQPSGLVVLRDVVLRYDHKGVRACDLRQSSCVPVENSMPYDRAPFAIRISRTFARVDGSQLSNVATIR